MNILLKPAYKNNIAVFIILLVNAIFFYKYAVIYTKGPQLLTLLYLGVFLLLIILISRSDEGLNLFKGKFLTAAVSFISVLVLLFVIFVPRFGEIGRLPAIETWIQKFLTGVFPYNSPLTPSSFPMTFIIALPFYLIGNTGLLSFIGVALLFYFVLTLSKTQKEISLKILLLLLSVTTAYEIVTRSELLFNIMLLVLVVFLSERKLQTRTLNSNFVLIAVITGLVLSTRSVTALLFLIYFLYKFKEEFKGMLIFGTIAVVVFITILIPFYLWDPESFNANGPFAVQYYLSSLPVIVIITLFAAAAYSGRTISSVYQFYFTGGLILFFASSVSFLLRISEIGFTGSLINDGYDIAYFIFCVPLFILSIEYESISPVKKEPNRFK